MKFAAKAGDIAQQKMQEVNPALADRYACVIRFLAKNPDLAKKMKGVEAGTTTYIEKQARAFNKARLQKLPKVPSTVPDELVSLVLTDYFDVPEKKIGCIKQTHSLSMAAENFVGEMLERYLASVLELNGWVWCSGSTVKSIDFIKPPSTVRGKWVALQVKNRDNSENSSSKTVRNGTDIKKWHRTFSKRTGSNWANFPDEGCRRKLSEVRFEAFVRRYLKKWRQEDV